MVFMAVVLSSRAEQRARISYFILSTEGGKVYMDSEDLVSEGGAEVPAGMIDKFQEKRLK